MSAAKVILLAVSAILVVSGAAIVLANDGGSSQEKDDMVIEKYVEAGDDSLQAAVGEDVVISLAANATTGYSWVIKSSDGLEKTKDWYEVEKGREGLCGAGGTQYFQFHCEKAGTYKVVLDYQRPWEDAPIQTTTVDVIVK
ncbi:MAG: hypothetical protein E7Z65_02680 [Thermoplasmata archaeon]|nr:hypothetical protein [Thermoplasmata archaeon]